MRSSLKLASALLITLAFPFFGTACVAFPDAEDAMDEASPSEHSIVADTGEPGTAIEAAKGCGCGCSGGHCSENGCGAHGCVGCTCGCNKHRGGALGRAGGAFGGSSQGCCAKGCRAPGLGRP